MASFVRIIELIGICSRQREQPRDFFYYRSPDVFSRVLVPDHCQGADLGAAS